MTGFWIGVAASIITGALVNEFCDVSPWLARKLVRRAARRWGTAGSDLAHGYEAEWAAVIEDCPGKITKLTLAMRFFAGAVWRAERGRLRLAARQLRDGVAGLRLNDPENFAETLTQAMAPSLVLAALAGWVSLAQGLDVAQSAGISTAVLSFILACLAVRSTEAAAHHAERKLETALTAELRSASSYAKMHGTPHLWLQVIGDGFVIMRHGPEAGIEAWELWNPRTAAFVPFSGLTVMPDMRVGRLRLVTDHFDAALWRVWMRHTGLRRSSVIRPRPSFSPGDL